MGTTFRKTQAQIKKSNQVLIQFIRAPTTLEIKNAKLKNDKSSEIDGMHAELIKFKMI